MKNIIQEIKQKKNLLKMTNKDLSIKSGVSLGTINKILSNGTKTVKQQTLLKINDALKIDNQAKTNLGFIKVGAYSIETSVACVSKNVSKIIEGINLAYSFNVNLLCFNALTLSGATCGDLFYQSTLLSACEQGLKEIRDASKNKNMLIFVGLPFRLNGSLYNVATAICDGQILGFTPIFNRKNGVNGLNFSQFSNNFTDTTVLFDGACVPFGSNLYECKNMPSLTVKVDNGVLYSKADATILVNLSCANELVGGLESKQTYIKCVTRENNSGYIYANSSLGESTTDYVFSGSNIICENGNILKESKRFTSGLIFSDLDVEFLQTEKAKNGATLKQNLAINKVLFTINDFSTNIDREFSKTPFIPTNKIELNERAELILSMQAHALAKRVKHVNAKKLVIGVSGGLDSTLALLVCVRACKLLNKPSSDVLAITMPCFGTTSRTKNNAEALCKALNVTFKEIDIKNAVLTHFKDIGQSENDYNVAFENSQARERTQVLMDVANKENGLVVGTGDLSELALGFATFNGDHISNYAVNSSIPKTLIFYLVKYEANRLKSSVKDTLNDIVSTPVSPELLPPSNDSIKQKTEDIVGPYILHDFFLYYALRRYSSPKKVYEIAKITFKNEFDSKTIKKWLKNFYSRFFNQQFKRSCLPDGVKIGSVGVSPRGDFSMPSDAIKNDFIKEIDELEE
ncbi:MAG: NAD(+) synthase [Clostridia bacterium]|nr:NAD(+) synthase [Clostridia bacterium]